MGDDENGAVLEWFDKVWEAGRSSQPAQKDEDEMLGPARLQKWAANYIKSDGRVPVDQHRSGGQQRLQTAAAHKKESNK